MKGFIEVKRVFRDKRYLKSININNIIDFEDYYITTKKILGCEYTQTSYSETVRVEESYEEIKELIKQATEL